MQELVEETQLREASIEDGDELKSEQGLNAGQHHARFLDCLLRLLRRLFRGDILRRRTHRAISILARG
jgi:hypothetical protein